MITAGFLYTVTNPLFWRHKVCCCLSHDWFDRHLHLRVKRAIRPGRNNLNSGSPCWKAALWSMVPVCILTVVIPVLMMSWVADIEECVGGEDPDYFRGWLSAAFFIIQTASTVGYGDSCTMRILNLLDPWVTILLSIACIGVFGSFLSMSHDCTKLSLRAGYRGADTCIHRTLRHEACRKSHRIACCYRCVEDGRKAAASRRNLRTLAGRTAAADDDNDSRSPRGDIELQASTKQPTRKRPTRRSISGKRDADAVPLWEDGVAESKASEDPTRSIPLWFSALFVVAVNVVVFGVLIYPNGGDCFDDPNWDFLTFLYWLTTTVTTVGYGDYVPQLSCVGGRISVIVAMFFGVSTAVLLLTEALAHIDRLTSAVHKSVAEARFKRSGLHHVKTFSRGSSLAEPEPTSVELRG
jgi:hypothetical protein